MPLFRSSTPAPIPIIIPFRTAVSSQIWTDMPAALTEFNGTTAGRVKADLTNVTQMRLVIRMLGTATVANAELRVQYSTDDSTFAYLDGGTGPACVVSVTNTTVVSSWVTIVAAAKADVFLRVIGIGGDGVVDPSFGNLQVEVR